MHHASDERDDGLTEQINRELNDPAIPCVTTPGNSPQRDWFTASEWDTTRTEIAHIQLHPILKRVSYELIERQYFNISVNMLKDP
jgi:hypothetical protein